MSPPIALSKTQAAVCRIMQADRLGLEKLVFRRYPEREWGSFFSFGYRRTPGGVVVCFRDQLAPQSGDLDPQSSIVEFRPGYIVRAISALESDAFGVGVVHSHPEDCGTGPSWLDDDMDRYFAEISSTYGEGRPYCSLIVSRSSDGRVHFSGRLFDRGQWMPVEELFTVGFPLRRDRNELLVTPISITLVVARAESPTARLDTLVGERSRQRLNRARVGVIGFGGTGSPAVHALARAGVGEFVVVDYQFFGRSNLERMHGSTFADTQAKPPPHKTEIAIRLIHAINPQARVTVIKGNLLDEAVLDALLRCDLVLGCSDTQHARAAMGDFASHYLLPGMDIGVAMEGRDGRLTEQKGELTVYGPEKPCAFCRRRIDSDLLAFELMPEEERAQRRDAAALARLRGNAADAYWRGEPRQLLTVGYLTGVVGNLAAGYALGWITGAFQVPHDRFQFDLGMPELNVQPIANERRPTCTCGRTKGGADQVRADRSVSRPPHWD